MCAAAELPSEAELVEILKPGTPLRLPQSMWADFVAPMVSATMPEGYWDAKVFNVKDGRATSKNWRVQVARHLAGQALSHTSSLTAATSCPQPHAHSPIHRPMPTDSHTQPHTWVQVNMPGETFWKDWFYARDLLPHVVHDNTIDLGQLRNPTQGPTGEGRGEEEEGSEEFEQGEESEEEAEESEEEEQDNDDMGDEEEDDDNMDSEEEEEEDSD